MYPGSAQFCLSMTFDIEMSFNFPYWTSNYDDYRRNRFARKAIRPQNA